MVVTIGKCFSKWATWLPEEKFEISKEEKSLGEESGRNLKLSLQCKWGKKIGTSKWKVFLEFLLFRDENISSVVEWLEHCDYDQHGLGLKPTRAILLCSFGKDTLRHFPLRGSLGKQFQISVISLYNLKNKIKNFNQTAISGHLQKQVGLIACPIYCVVMLSASQEDKYRDEIK